MMATTPRRSIAAGGAEPVGKSGGHGEPGTAGASSPPTRRSARAARPSSAGKEISAKDAVASRRRGSRSSRRPSARRCGTGGCRPVRWRSPHRWPGRPEARPGRSPWGPSRGRRQVPRRVQEGRRGRGPVRPVPAGGSRPGRLAARLTVRRARSAGRGRSGGRPVERRGRAGLDRRRHRRRGTGRAGPVRPTSRPPPGPRGRRTAEPTSTLVRKSPWARPAPRARAKKPPSGS